MQLLVWIVDKVSQNQINNYTLHKRGDVIAVKPQGADWGIQELIHPGFRIIQAPGMTEAEANSFLPSETPPLNKPNQPTRPRAMMMDFVQFNLKGYNIDAPRVLRDEAAAIDAIKKGNIPPEVSSNKVDVLSVKTLKVQTDPSTIGAEAAVIG